MEDEPVQEIRLPTTGDFDRLQEKLDDVGSELATLKRLAEHLLDAAQAKPTVSLTFDDQ